MIVITEFDAGDPDARMHALADEILKYRRALRLLATAIGWADARAPFALIAPGPLTGSGARSWSSKLHAQRNPKEALAKRDTSPRVQRPARNSCTNSCMARGMGCSGLRRQ